MITSLFRSSDDGIPVWDLPTRAFHWLLVAMVALAWVTAEAKGAWFWLHVVFGEAALALVIFRLIWGFIGGRYARFSSFVRGPRAVMAHLRSLLTRHPDKPTGHNPAAGWMILALLGTTFVASFSGLFLIEPPYMGPFARFGDMDDDLHEGAAELLIILIGIHVPAVVLMSLMTGENLISAMWTGKKRDTGDEATPSVPPPPVTVSHARAVLAALLGGGLALLPFL